MAATYYKNVDLILMDVELSDNNGIEILKTIGGMFNGVISIVSSFIDYAPEGYKVNAFRYLVKFSMEFEEGLREIVELAYGLFSLSEHKIYEYNFREKLYSFELNNLKYIIISLFFLIKELLKRLFKIWQKQRLKKCLQIE